MLECDLTRWGPEGVSVRRPWCDPPEGPLDTAPTPMGPVEAGEPGHAAVEAGPLLALGRRGAGRPDSDLGRGRGPIRGSLRVGLAASVPGAGEGGPARPAAHHEVAGGMFRHGCGTNRTKPQGSIAVTSRRRVAGLPREPASLSARAGALCVLGPWVVQSPFPARGSDPST